MASPPPQPAAFSTRFLASDGIPAYNALLDSHLGKRREFLLGNKRSLEHLQRTGAIARVEEKPENPSQYVVYMNDPKPAMASASSASSSVSAIRRAPTMSHDLFSRSRPPLKTVARSESTPQFALAATGAASGRRRRRRVSDDRDEDDDDGDEKEHDGDDTDRRSSSIKLLARSRSASTATLRDDRHTQPSPSPSAVIDRLRRRRSTQADPATMPPTKDRSTVERLLESDAAYQLKLQILRDEMQVLEREKQYFEMQIATMRKRLRGVNAVHENDVAVAHCAAIMHARIVKAEEEYMKLVTAQQQVKTDIDTLRRELLAMRKVQKKLVDDIADVEAANAAVVDKIRAAKSVRNVLSQELVELERRAELEAEEQRLKLPPEEDVVVDANELMSAVQQRPPGDRRTNARRSTVVLTAGSPLEILQRMLSEKAIVSDAVVLEKPLLPFRRAFRVIQQTLGSAAGTRDHEHDDCTDGQELDRFVTHFEETEDALLSKHKLNGQLQDEVNQLEQEAAKLAHEAAKRSASMRGTQHEATTKQHELQDKVQHTLQRIDSYNELRDVRNYEQTRLRAIMQRCLEILHAEKLVNSQESLGGPVLLSELSPPVMLEALQKKMAEVAITLKLQHHANKDEDVADKPTDRHASVVHNRSNCARPTSANRRSNLLQKRDAGASNIVLGPREPSGAALTAIRITAQPPTVEGAQVLSETHAAGMHALHPTIINAATAASKPPRKLTITRMASIRAGKRASAFSTTNGSLRRISAPVSSSPSEATTPPVNTRPSRVSMMWPVRNSSRKLDLGGSTTSLQLQADDAHAHVVESTDELDE